MKILGYTVASDINLEQLENKVHVLISQGWQPIGGVSVTSEVSEEPGLYVQALVMYDDEEEL